MKRRLILLMATIALVGAKTQAQTAVATAGGEAGTVSFTVGQAFVDPVASDAGSITPGVQQAYEITIVDGIENTFVTLEAAVYPNPTADWLTLSVDNYDSAPLRYTLTDNNGRTIETADVVDQQTQIDMSSLTPAVYFLRVDNGERVVKTFKIVKN